MNADGVSFTARRPGGDHDAQWTGYTHPQPPSYGLVLGLASSVAVDCAVCGQVDDPPIEVLAA